MPGLDFNKTWLAQNTNPLDVRGAIADAARGVHLFLGVSGPGRLPVRVLKKMAKNPIIFAMANPGPRSCQRKRRRMRKLLRPAAAIIRTRLTTASASPAFSPGAPDARVREVNEPIKLAAARAIAGCIDKSERSRDCILPSVFNKQVVRFVVHAVAAAAYTSGVAKRRCH